MIKRILTILILILPALAYPQRIENVKAGQEGKRIVIYYDLTGAKQGQKFNVSVYCSTDGGNYFGNALRRVEGDVGDNITAGYNKRIIWDVLQDREKLTGDRIQFKIKAIISGEAIEGMVFVKGGTFQMGSDSGEDDEKPVHTVTVNSFYIGKYEVTQKQWKEVMGSNPSNFKGCDNCPVEKVSWNDTQEFLRKLNAQTGENYRLPTEAEWEYAVRGGNKSVRYIYSGSNDVGNVAWYRDNSGNKTHPAGQKQPNELDIYDMSGNVLEWCSDWYNKDYYSSSPQNNPKGSSPGSYRVIRGGSGSDGASSGRCSYRDAGVPGFRGSAVGFRLARDF